MAHPDGSEREAVATAVPSQGNAWARLAQVADWAASPLGPVAEWSVALRQAVALCLDASIPMVLGWGRELVVIANQAALALCGQSGLGLLGRPLREVAASLRDLLGPTMERALLTGQPVSFPAQPSTIQRCGQLEEIYLGGSIAPIRAEDGTIGGALAILQEATAQVLRERRLRLLHDLARDSAGARTAEAACRAAAETLTSAPTDIPFALIYLLEAEPPRRAWSVSPE